MGKKWNKVLALLLVLIMFTGSMPIQSQAATKKAAVNKVVLNKSQYVLKKGEKLKLKATISPAKAKSATKELLRNNFSYCLSFSTIALFKNQLHSPLCAWFLNSTLEEKSCALFKSYFLTVPKLKWTSSNRKIATVSSKGVVTAKAKKGKVKITVKAGKKRAACNIILKNGNFYQNWLCKLSDKC